MDYYTASPTVARTLSHRRDAPLIQPDKVWGDSCRSSYAQLAQRRAQTEHRSCGAALQRNAAAAAPDGRSHHTTLPHNQEPSGQIRSKHAIDSCPDNLAFHHAASSSMVDEKI
jgi:hypothetical protein